MAISINDLNDLFNSIYGSIPKDQWTVSHWQKHNNITAEDLQLYENARISQSKLARLLDETPEEEKRDMTQSPMKNLYENYAMGLTAQGRRWGKPSFTGTSVLVNPNTYNALLEELTDEKKKK